MLSISPYHPSGEVEFTDEIEGLDVSSKISNIYINHSEKSGEQYSRYMKTKNLDYHTVCYEDFLHPDNDIDHRVATFKGILSYIDWEYNESETILQALSPKGKQYTDHHYNKIPNIEEIYRWRDDLSK